MPAKEGGLKRAMSQCWVRRQREMTCHITEVLDTGSKWTFQNPSHFCKWLVERKKNPAELYIRGVPVRGGRGSTEVARFLAKQLRLPNPLHRWQKWKVAYLVKRCGHRSGEEGAACKPQFRKLHDDDLPEASGASSAAILKDESAILCAKTTILESEHSTAVTSSGRGYIRRFIPEPG